jgi:hypothetical protein
VNGRGHISLPPAYPIGIEGSVGASGNGPAFELRAPERMDNPANHRDPLDRLLFERPGTGSRGASSKGQRSEPESFRER